MRIFFLTAVGLALWLTGCKSQQKVVTNEEPPVIEIVEDRQLDTLFVTAPAPQKDPASAPDDYELPTYQPSHTRINDLLHTRLDLRFDWEKEAVIGEAILTFQPYFYPTRTLTLDAKDFELHQVSFAGSDQPLAYEYDGRHLTIDLGREYNKDETYQLFIDYTARPSTTGGSAAITSDQGLFFINPQGEEPGKPRQIWTQGETEWNSRWFPTIDKPNERTTQEIFLTVDNQFTTLSNGLLIASRENEDGSRTDHWKLDQPHAPYLFMIAVGEYAVVRDEWNDIPVEYYVETEYEQDARAIFSHTPEMLTFFSDKLDLTYPWPKYSQIVVRDYVSGAMENTTSTIYGEFVQRHRRDLIDNHNEGIIAHELFHHWFGDYVTCESWANLTMNEGFANYSEYLWFEHQYGRDAADYHLIGEWSGYLGSARNDIHPLIYFGYENRESMFDAHSYNKGGSVLHMLRHYVGDDAFWAALNRYLTDNAYEAVEAHDLRLAFEKVTGEDLNWFFNQWYFRQGHPVLEIEYGYEVATGEAILTVRQIQDPATMPAIFILPVVVDVYLAADTPPLRRQIEMREREQVFRFPVEKEPELILFDAERMLLCERQDNKTEDQLVFQFFNAPRLFDRYESIMALRESEHPETGRVLQAALDDAFWVIRAIGIEGLETPLSGPALEKLRSLALNDPNSNVRTIALDKLADLEDEQAAAVARQVIERDSAYHTQASALYLLRNLATEDLTRYAEQLMDANSPQILEVVEIIFEESGNPEYLPFFADRLETVDGFGVVSLIGSYQSLALQADREKRMAAMEKLEKLALRAEQSPWRKLAAAKALFDTRQVLESRLEETTNETDQNQLQAEIETLRAMLTRIKKRETDPELKQIYEQFD